MKGEDSLLVSAVARFFALGGAVGRLASALVFQQVLSPARSAETRQEKLLATLVRHTGEITGLLGRLKGGAMKIGQMLSLQEGLLPPEVTAILSALQRDAPSLPFSRLRDRFEAELPEHRLLFESVAEQPLAAASIGQVHRAVLKDGREVVIKVQYPSMESIVRSDLKNLRQLFRIFGGFIAVDLDPIWDEVGERLNEELDYEREGRQQQAFRERFSDEPRIHVPDVIFEASTRSILTTTYEPGESLSQKARADQNERNSVGALLFEFLLEQIFVHQILHADPHPGNFAFRPDGTLILYDFGSIKQVPDFLLSGYRKLLRAGMENAPEQIPGILKTMRVHHQDGTPIKLEIVRDYLSAFSPIFGSRYRFGADDDLLEKAITLGRRYWLEALGVVFPPDVIFIDRTVAGTLGNLRSLRAESDWRRLLEKHAAPAGVS